QRAVRAAAEHLVGRGVDRVQRAGEAGVDHAAPAPAPGLVRDRRGPDDRHAPRVREAIEWMRHAGAHRPVKRGGRLPESARGPARAPAFWWISAVPAEY